MIGRCSSFLPAEPGAAPRSGGSTTTGMASTIGRDRPSPMILRSIEDSSAPGAFSKTNSWLGNLPQELRLTALNMAGEFEAGAPRQRPERDRGGKLLRGPSDAVQQLSRTRAFR